MAAELNPGVNVLADKAYVYRLLAARTLEASIDEIPMKSVGSSEIIARTSYSAVSPGTEIAAYRGDPPLRFIPTYPRLLGYCNVSEVLKVGAAVKTVAVGDFILTNQSHRSHFKCEERDILAKLYPSVSLEHASLTYLYYLGLNALQKGNYKSGMNVAVIGLGVLGLTTTSVAAISDTNVYAISNLVESRNIAIKLGAKESYSKSEAALEQRIMDDTGGIGCDLVVVTSNLWSDWKLALSIAREYGVISVLGFPGRGQGLPQFNPLDPRYLYGRQLTIVAAGQSAVYETDASIYPYSKPHACRTILNWMADQTIDPEWLISNRLSWRDLELFYAIVERRKTGLMTAILDWNS